jgi:hypothetical protein
MERKVVTVEPVFNRMVIFTTSDTSYHGHPEPLRCPPGRSRRSLALYYYALPADAAAPAHNTMFQVRGRPNGEAEPGLRGDRVRAIAKDWLPPAVVRVLRRARPGAGTGR